MKIIHESIQASSVGFRPTFHNVTEAVQRIVDKHGIQSGICAVYTSHTTCSVITQECSFDQTYTGLEFLQQDLLDIMEAIIPTCRKEGQYMHPGPLLTEFSAQHGENKPQTLNTDAHLRSSIVGRSESLGIVNGTLDLGSFGQLFFIDFDQTCTRDRQIKVQIIGE